MISVGLKWLVASSDETDVKIFDMPPSGSIAVSNCPAARREGRNHNGLCRGMNSYNENTSSFMGSDEH
jgi:hypothetical protein